MAGDDRGEARDTATGGARRLAPRNLHRRVQGAASDDDDDDEEEAAAEAACLQAILEEEEEEEERARER